MQLPAWHVAGAMHGSRPPQVHVPSAEQPSPWLPHTEQLPPPPPQSFGSFPGWQRLLLSQHPEHEVTSQLQTPLAQYCPLRQAAPPLHVHWPAEHPSPEVPQPVPHACPFVPHVAPATGAHVPASVQQLFGHEAASQMHEPFEQTWPGAHGAD